MFRITSWILCIVFITTYSLAYVHAQSSDISSSEKTDIELETQTRIYRQTAKARQKLTIAKKEDERRMARLKKLENEVIRRYKVLRQVQDELTATLKRSKNNEEDTADEEPSADRKAKRTKEIRSLAKTFNAMKPAQAAKVIEVMDEDLVVDVLRQVKPRQSGKILGAVKPEIAARISEQMTSSRRSRKTSN